MRLISGVLYHDSIAVPGTNVPSRCLARTFEVLIKGGVKVTVENNKD